MTARFRVATYPNGEKRWHVAGGTMVPGFVSERDATIAEAAIMAKILADDAAGKMPHPALGTAVRNLMAVTP